MQDKRANIAEELKLIPWWGWLLAAAAFLCIQMVVHVMLPQRAANPPALALRVVWGIFSGTVIAFFFLMTGYVNADAKRRGMNAWIWTPLVLFVPYFIGFVVYFLVRQPVKSSCPRCATQVDAGFNYCPKCHYELTPTCPHCKRTVRPGDAYCPYCGGTLGAALGSGA